MARPLLRPSRALRGPAPSPLHQLSDCASFRSRLATEHGKLRQSPQQLADQQKTTIAPHASKEWWQGEIQCLRGLNGPDFDREFLIWELPTRLAAVNLYQTQASHTPVSELAKYAITTLVTLKQQFDTAQQLAKPYGLKADVVRQPPQY